MSVTKLSTKDFNIEKCLRCKRKFTRAMMLEVKSNNFKCIRCFNGGKIYEKTINFINSIK